MSFTAVPLSRRHVVIITRRITERHLRATAGRLRTPVGYVVQMAPRPTNTVARPPAGRCPVDRSARQCDVFAGAGYQGPMRVRRATTGRDAKTNRGGTAPDRVGRNGLAGSAAAGRGVVAAKQVRCRLAVCVPGPHQ